MAGTVDGMEEFQVVGLVRLVRRLSGISQRELAARLDMPLSTISRIEAGSRIPTIATVVRILRVAGLRLVVVDHEGRLCTPLLELPRTRDWGGRKWPAHLGLILDPHRGEWWGDRYGLVRPPETVHRDPATRERHREVFHRFRDIGARWEPLDWRIRRLRKIQRLAAGHARRAWHAARQPGGAQPCGP